MMMGKQVQSAMEEGLNGGAEVLEFSRTKILTQTKGGTWDL